LQNLFAAMSNFVISSPGSVTKLHEELPSLLLTTKLRTMKSPNFKLLQHKMTIPRIAQDMGRFGAHPTSITSGILPVFLILRIIILGSSRQVASFLPVLKNIIVHIENCVRMPAEFWTIPM
jgi:hypothetical protein